MKIAPLFEAQAELTDTTANPLTGLRAETVIDATLGLGEALVSGQVEPDHWVVESTIGRILEERTGAKQAATVTRSPAEHGFYPTG